ncbi:Chromatin SPT2 [Penicillium waksmanii]|uniref:Chromatin SPT2 n=1 Tax=Penicillium waksmanii TaxID=69791 RepID=UPI0025473929|nr:Chromatin SPT2 [Penicillium waksmanii]KAJ5974275.1 Chromatin SPT2 [Penicillium waksmanii]
MSFLDSVLSSLGPTTRPPQSPLSQSPVPPAPSSIPKKEDRNLPNLPRPAPSRPAPSNETTSGNFNGGIKRKAEDQLPHLSRPSIQPPAKSPAVRPVISSGSAKAAPPVPKSASAPSLKAKTASPNPVSKNGTLGSSRPVPTKPAPPRAAPAKVVPAKAVATKPAAPAKAPPKGSYAALMEAAKAAQGKAPTQVGIIRNQAAPKERLSKVERKRRLLEAQEKEKAERKAKRFDPSSTTKGKVTPKKVESDAPSYKGTAKPSRTPEPVSYRGTANLPTNRTSNDRRPHGKRRRDEYLGTDEEEEEGDYGADDYDNYYSDSSDDMEAGFDAVNLEENTALRIAQKDDEEELRMETLAKKAKFERQQKLAALASRTKR